MIEKTLLQIIVDAERELYQVAGTAVQVYSQDNLQSKVQNGFELVFDDTTVKWKRFQSQVQFTLDGVTGRTTVPVKNTFKNYEDIENIYPDLATTPLSMWNSGNSFAVIGGYPLFYTADATDIVRVIPATAKGKIVISGKVRPTFPFGPTDVVPFDYLTLVYFAAWQYSVDDGTNPSAAEKLRQLFEQRYKQMKLNQSKEPISLGGGSSSIPHTWGMDD
jgi:hypothetical protein